MARRRSSGTVAIDVGTVDIDVSDILNDIDTEALMLELATRDDKPSMEPVRVQSARSWSSMMLAGS